jgi:hypothetical protein
MSTFFHRLMSFHISKWGSHLQLGLAGRGKCQCIMGPIEKRAGPLLVAYYKLHRPP